MTSDDADTRPRLIARLAGAPPVILVERSCVADDVWYRFARTIADEMPRAGAPMVVQLRRFLRERLTLRGLLQRHGVNFSVDAGVDDLLRRSLEDRRVLGEALAPADGDSPLEPLDLHPPAEIQVPGLIRDLRGFQQRDLARLIHLRHGANFSVPGAGKTTVTYAIHAIERAAARVNRLLVVAPLSAFGAWEEEAEAVLAPAPRVTRWRSGGVPQSDVVLVNYQRLPGALPALTSWMRTSKVHLVIDEAHRAKRGALGEWGRALLVLAPLAVRRDLLTGTPAPNHPRDLAALLDILWPGGGAPGLPPAALRRDPPHAAMADVNRTIRPLYVRTTKDELELPPIRITPDPVPLTDLQQQIYDALLNRYSGLFDLDRRDAEMFAKMGEVAMYLLQAASSPRLLADNADPARSYRYPSLGIPAGTPLARLIDTYADHEVPAKIQRACRIVHANACMTPRHKTLVWSNFPDNLLDLEQQLAALNPALVYGAIPSMEDAEPGMRTRERELARFRDDDSCLVLLANPAALAEGISLHQVCHDAVYIDRTFNAGQYLQSLDRIHRLGLEPGTDTRITLLIASGTIDERVNRRVEDKTRRLARMLDDPTLVQMALPDDEDGGGVIDDEADLEEILTHLAEGLPRGGDTNPDA
jgi:SNF2 family DNA or RNA helicase